MVFELRFQSNFKKIRPVILCLLIAFILFSGCGSDKSDEVLIPGKYTAYTVTGLEYKCKNQSNQPTRVGATSEEGRFYYKENEKIQFMVGGIPLGEELTPKFKLTPLDYDSGSLIGESSLNIATFLQSLDDDLHRDPKDIEFDCPQNDDEFDCNCDDGACDVTNFSNGIRITKSVRDLIKESGITSINFSQSSETFATDASVTSLFNYLNEKGAFYDSPNRKLLDSATAQENLRDALAETNSLPVVIINLGDGLTCGTQSGLTHEYTQSNGFAALLASQIGLASSFDKWKSPQIDLKTLCKDDDSCSTPKYKRQGGEIRLEEDEIITDRVSNDINDIIDTLQIPWLHSNEEYGLYYQVPTNYAVQGATSSKLINDPTIKSENEALYTGTTSLIDAILTPLKWIAEQLDKTDDTTYSEAKEYAGQELTQLDAAQFMASLNKGKQKIFTVWIGLNDVLEAIKDPENPFIIGNGSNMVKENIEAYLKNTVSGTDAESVKNNLTTIVETLSTIPDSHVFIANLPEITDLGFLFSNKDIEHLAAFEEKANVTALKEGEYIGLLPLMNRKDTVVDGVYSTLNSEINPSIIKSLGPYADDTDANNKIPNTNAILNNAITSTLNADDGYVLSSEEADLLNQRISEINQTIESLASGNDNVTLVDLKTNIYDKLLDYPMDTDYDFDDMFDGMTDEEIKKIKTQIYKNYLYITVNGTPNEDENGNTISVDYNTDWSFKDWEYRLLSRSFGGGFYSLDGVHPSDIGYYLIANEFIKKINESKLGLDIDEFSAGTLETQYSYDPYQDDDRDGFVPGPSNPTTDDDFWHDDDDCGALCEKNKSVSAVCIYPFYEGLTDCHDSYDNDLSPYAEGKENCSN